MAGRALMALMLAVGLASTGCGRGAASGSSPNPASGAPASDTSSAPGGQLTAEGAHGCDMITAGDVRRITGFDVQVERKDNGACILATPDGRFGGSVVPGRYVDLRSSLGGEHVPLSRGLTGYVSGAGWLTTVIYPDGTSVSLLIGGSAFSQPNTREDMRARLLDFGVAKWLGEEGDPGVTAAFQHAGPLTPTYAAPEQLLGEPVTTATDVYALGVMLCELLAGSLPYEVADASRRRFERAILDRQPRPPSACLRPAVGPGVVPLAEWRAQLRGDLDLIVLKALRKEPDERYPSVTALAEDVQRYLANYPISLRMDAWSYRARKFVARHRVAVIASVLAGLSIVGGTAGTVWQAHRARAEAERARAVQEFVVSLFRSTDPGAGSRSRTVSDLLDQGEARIDAELAQQPGLQIELWRTVADVRRQLGDYERAERLLEKAIGRTTEVAPSEELERARLRLQLAMVLNDHYKVDDAARLATEVLPVLERRLPRDREELGHAYDLVGSIRYQTGDYAEAERLRLLAREVFARAAGPRSRQVANIDSNLSVFYSERGRHEEAEAAGRRAVEVRHALLGDEHPDTLRARYNLANAIYQAGRWNEASSEFAGILPAQERALGLTHPHAALTRRQLARIDTGLGRYDEAARLLDEAAEATTSAFGRESVPAAYLLVQRSRFEQLRGWFDDAVRLGRDAAGMLERVSGGDHPDTAWARMSLADRLIDVGRDDEAGALLDAALAVFRRSAGSDPYLPQALDLQGVLAYRAGRAGEARAAFQQALDLLGDDATKALDGATARWHLAVVLDDPAQFDRRVRLFQEAVQALRRGYPPQHGMVTEALVPYGVFLARMGRFDDARTLLREVWDIRRRTLGEDNLLTAEAASALAWCLSRTNRPDEGRRLAAMAGPVLARTPGRRSWWEPVVREIPGATVAARRGQKP